MQLAKYFSEHYTIFQARSKNHIDESYRIRHQVYCEEFGYEPVRQDGLESDKYDAQSFHCLVQEKSSGVFIGCMRYIQGQQDHNQGLLPIFEGCPEALDPRLFAPGDYHPQQIGEVSRLSVLSSHRMSRSDRNKSRPGATDSQAERARRAVERRMLAVVPLALFVAGVVIVETKPDVKLSIAMMEPSLGRMLRMSGLPFEQVGKMVDYHGPRAPFIIRRENMFNDLSDDMLELYRCVQHQLRTAHRDDQQQPPLISIR